MVAADWGCAMKRREIPCAALLYLLFVLSLPMQGQVPSSVLLIFAGSGFVFVADFNGDGKPDLLASDGTMNLGNGDGTFTPGTNVTVPLGGIWAVGDFNGDGKPDILEQGTGTLLVLLGNGDGTFQKTAISTVIGTTLMWPVAADLNGDGKADLIGVSNNTLPVYLSNGDGTFAAGVPLQPGNDASCCLFSLGDFNGDSKTDVAVVTSEVGGTSDIPGQEIVLLGNGDGTFQPAKTSVGSILYPDYAAVGDVNADGKTDLAVNGCDLVYGCTVYISLANGDGTFQTPYELVSGTPPPLRTGTLTGADFNGDGTMDLIWGQLGNPGNPVVAKIYLAKGDGTFSNTTSYLLNPVSLSGAAVADFNGDGKPDVAMGNTVLLGNGDGTFRGIECACPLPAFTGLDFALAPVSSFSQTVSAGQTAKFDLSFLPAFYFNATVNLSCAITPAVSPAPSCNLSSASLQIVGAAPPVSLPVTVNVSTTAAMNANGATPVIDPPGAGLMIWMGMLLGSCWLCVRTRKRVPALIAPAVALLLTSVLSCGGGGPPQGSPGGTPSGTYTATITATSGKGVSYNLPLTVVVR
jgi:FG-GAP-like repeat